MSLTPPETKGVEDLNPRSHAVRDLRMAAKRAIILTDLMHECYVRCGSRVSVLKQTPPSVFGSTSFEYVDRKGHIHTAMRTVWGDQYWSHPEYRMWPELVEMWREGSLDRQIRDIAANLPEKIRKKLGV